MTVSKEVRDGLQTIFLPPIDVVVPGADPHQPTDEHDMAYNAWCNKRILEELKKKDEENQSRIANLRGATNMLAEDREALIESLKVPMARTRYPSDDFDSEDIVSLNRDGEIVVLDAGSR